MKPLQQHFIIFLVLLGLPLVQAQGFVPGDTPNVDEDILAGAGSLDDALNGLFTLFDDFSLENFASFACSSATAANEIEGSGDSQTAQDIACSIAALPEEIESLLENYETLIQDAGKDFFEYVTASAVGSDNYLTAEQIETYVTRMKTALDEYEDPETFLQETYAIIDESSAAENANFDAAPEGSSEAAFRDALNFNPALATSYGLGQIEEAETMRRDSQSVAGMMETANASEISTKTSEFQDELADAINQEIAPELRDDAATAVSTRAVTQTLVDAVTMYMQQEVTSDANLSKQLAMQSQQEVYTTQALHMLVQSLSQEQRTKVQQEQTALKTAISEHKKKVEGSVDTTTNMGLSFTTLDDPIDIDTSLFDF
jgi:hypothetical protein